MTPSGQPDCKQLLTQHYWQQNGAGIQILNHLLHIPGHMFLNYKHILINTHSMITLLSEALKRGGDLHEEVTNTKHRWYEKLSFKMQSCYKSYLVGCPQGNFEFCIDFGAFWCSGGIYTTF